MTTNRTMEAFDAIMGSDIFRLNGPRIDLCAALEELAEAVHAEPEDSDGWIYLGEFSECTCADLIVGAYWALTEWHGGQWSDEYRAMCALSKVFSPGMSSAPTEEDGGGEFEAYRAVGDYFQAKHARKGV